MRRQQTLRASVDWSHALLTEPEQVLFRRLAVFLGGFDLDAAQAVAGGDDVERYQVLDMLTLLVDKSLVVAEDSRGRTRYRLLETMRQYALEKLGESREANEIRTRHRDFFLATAAQMDDTARSDTEHLLDRLEADIDNLRAAGVWCRESGEIEKAMRLGSSQQPLWLTRGRVLEGLAWLDAHSPNKPMRDRNYRHRAFERLRIRHSCWHLLDGRRASTRLTRRWPPLARSQRGVVVACARGARVHRIL